MSSVGGGGGGGIDNLDVIGKSQAQIVAILRIKPVGSIVHLLVRRQVHQCQLNTNNCLTCHFLLNSTYQCPNLLNTPMNQITNHLTCEKLSNWVDTRKCSSPPLQMTLYYDGLTNLERVYHPNYPNTIKLKTNINKNNDKINPINSLTDTSYIADSIYGGVIVKCVIEGGAAHKVSSPSTSPPPFFSLFTNGFYYYLYYINIR
ncbi:unnamed protein product [Schistosoma curassoni]|uniref:Uncharacterized protein n=1 Tax=Schistosoma curassoni TaxID=6186 RepID=A0A183JJ84_9TREM|nr:unnamed protein product [Schistosoma curassoni]